MAFHVKKSPSQMMSDVINYQQHLKNDSELKHFKTQEGLYLNSIRMSDSSKVIETEEQKKNNNYHDLIQEKKDE